MVIMARKYRIKLRKENGVQAREDEANASMTVILETIKEKDEEDLYYRGRAEGERLIKLL